MAAESYPQDLKYYKEHDWVRLEGDEVRDLVVGHIGEVVDDRRARRGCGKRRGVLLVGV